MSSTTDLCCQTLASSKMVLESRRDAIEEIDVDNAVLAPVLPLRPTRLYAESSVFVISRPIHIVLANL
ncbi:hypothetical protein RGR602_PC01622 (plasmid) [Rhizobium gallicum bv. gallicum R602sp]|uniref:Uncharacterized protein n=1 Tax=Rhizobium gallicum bv. gallicum R602sp TaxID=1041138 RepID=A0A0B4XG86_9HYPH|nr:hypothetical protein RGR602_PC01622 [Rhizobium gallicum bv. gallicum R602sp]